MPNKLKLVHFTYSWISSGVSSFLSSITQELTDDFDQTIVVWDDRGSVFDEEIRNAGVDIYPLCKGRAHGLADLPAACLAFRFYLKKHRPDIVHLHCSTSLELKLLEVAKQEHVPVRISHCHNAGFEGSRLAKYLKKEIHISRKEDFADAPTLRLACSDDAGKWLYNEGEVFTVIKNPVNVERFLYSDEKRNALRAELGLGDSFVFCCTGRLSEQKNQKLLISAFARYHQKRPDSELLLAGDGPDRGALQRQSDELGVDHCVHFLGTVPDVGAVLSASDAYVLPSVYEGFGTAALEAETNGLPCLLSEAVSKAADVQNSAIWLSPQASAVLWSDGLDIIRSRSRYDGLPAILNSGFTKEKVASHLARLYHSALEKIDR